MNGDYSLENNEIKQALQNKKDALRDAINAGIERQREDDELDFLRELTVLAANIQAALADFERKHGIAIDNIYLRREDHDRDGKVVSMPWGSNTGKKYMTPIEGVDVSCDTRRKLISPSKMRELLAAEKAEADELLERERRTREALEKEEEARNRELQRQADDMAAVSKADAEAEISKA